MPGRPGVPGNPRAPCDATAEMIQEINILESMDAGKTGNEAVTYVEFTRRPK